MVRRIAIVTDSSSALDERTLRHLMGYGGFAMVPLDVFIDDQRVSERFAPSDKHSVQEQEAVVLAHVLGQKVHTSAPSPERFRRVYEAFAYQGYEAIISLHLSRHLSSAYSFACTAATHSPIPVYVIDSQTVGMALGHVVSYLHTMVSQGFSASELSQVAVEMLENTDIFFYVPTLDALCRSGRVHPALARVGQMLQVRPVGSIREGRLMYLHRPRSLERAQALLAEVVCERAACKKVENYQLEHVATPVPTGSIVAVHYCAQELEARRWASSYHIDPDFFVPLPTVLAAHAGLGAVAVVVY
ncbi:DegV family protein [Rothia sp. P6271]|uniref:DegV family protein n=1 Tax=unclassified Rothia (in: high G+C Gram-positive bacteria) TaxID=2689056 RepID=UPI003AD5ED72